MKRNLVAPHQQQPHLLTNSKKTFRRNQNCLSANSPGNATMPRSPDPLSLALLPPDQTPPKSPRTFADGAVGLGIVAAISAAVTDSKPIAVPPRSEPIPIVSPRTWPRGTGWTDAGEADEDEEELSESYTCVISHVAGTSVRKRVYFDDGSNGVRRNYEVSPGVFFQSPSPQLPVIKAADFMNRCYLCSKKLHGLDIFMYRGDEAFCSSECRWQQILNDEYMENCSSGALKQFEYYSVSPLVFSAGVAAA